MKFWTPKIRSEETSWSVILNPLKGELDKKRVAEKISGLFQLSFEEARELVQNTPMILLDNLSHPVAVQLQNIFQAVRAEVMVTNDSLFKRRCYRAVWPEPPNLSFLKAVSIEETGEKTAGEVSMETAVETVSTPEAVEGGETSSDSLQELEKKYRDLESLYEAETRENMELRQDRERALKEQAEKGAAQLRSSLEEWEERTQVLKDEFREAKGIYEEKLLSDQQELGKLEGRVKELGIWPEKALSLEREKKILLEKFNELELTKATLDQTLKERVEETGLWRERYQALSEKLERVESLYEEEKQRRAQAEEERHRAAETIDETRRAMILRETEAERWQKEFQELKHSQENLEREFADFSTQQQNEIKRLREANQQLTIQLESSQRQSRELLLRVEEQQSIERRSQITTELAEKETRLRELILRGERFHQEIQDRQLQAQTLNEEQAHLEREVLELKKTQRHLLEQSKLREKNNKFKRPGRPLDDEEVV